MLTIKVPLRGYESPSMIVLVYEWKSFKLDMRLVVTNSRSSLITSKIHAYQLGGLACDLLILFPLIAALIYEWSLFKLNNYVGLIQLVLC